ncbi:MAG: efflux RND transporter periplasmic adaptor subunit [Acidobacteriota bacterium]|nr:efflux RND transporter periplasmic adaptor subunit [Acidobacteriota bacterium]
MRRRLLVAGGLAIVAGLAAGCSQPKKVESAAPPPAVPVRVAQAVQKSLPNVVEAIGTGEAYSNVQIKPQVSGVLTGIFFKEGDFVHKGQLLFTIDPQPFQAALDQALGNLAKDKAQAQNAVVTAARYKKLFEEGIEPRQQYDVYQSQADSASAMVQADQAAVESARLQLSYCKIYSPMDGKTGALGVFAGNLVKANDVPVLVTINQINPIYVDFSVPENLLSQVRVALSARSPVRAFTQTDTAHAEAGRLSFVDNSVDATTGTIKLKGSFPNLDHRLWPGEFVTVNLQLGEDPNAIVVPSLALQTSQEGSYVWVVSKDNTVQMKTVTVKRQQQGEAVIASGLTPGDTVVTEGQLRLIPGARVDIRSTL